MKHLLTLFVVAAFGLGATAQIQTPAASPQAKLQQTVGLTEVTVDYSRPNMRGRTVYGDLVPYDKLWRTGANKNTTVSFSTDVTIAGSKVKAGTYAIFTKPGKSAWDVYFYSDTENWGTPQKWDESKVVAKATPEVYTMPMDIETFTITIDDVASGSAVLGILWEKTYVGVKFEVPTDEMVTASINRVMNGPTANDYFAAATYYSAEGKDIKQAIAWMDKAMSMTKEPAYWQYRQQSLLYAKAGEKSKAIEAAKKSLEGAKKAGNDDYIKMNEDSLAEWGAK
ncbi:DUF2911 domain-containing protein [Aegicerativicinus sediminis]|uniref:DUF2911 domain-containing protein n=1 Tax=Aegicerativicinus sediminis TaxID=2893202 RepID=UPI001E505738|nr:DUF2911 domain-containing protein [Aegicerativicinus sediminis]